jgi:hypothetical protein
LKFWTWAEIRQKVERDLDLEGETFITATEMLGYGNEAVDEVERQIHTLCEDYFLTRDVVTLVPDQEAYPMPSNIYANKLRRIVYRRGTEVWPVDRIRDWKKLYNYEVEKAYTIADARYGFFVVNTTPGTPEMLLAPTPTEAGAYLQRWYIRNANEMTDDASICDIPEAVNYVIAYIKVKCATKDMHPLLNTFQADLDKQYADTMKSLAEMVPDNENTIEADTRIYDEMN